MGDHLCSVACETGSDDVCAGFDLRLGVVLATFAGSPGEEALDGASSMEDLRLERLDMDTSTSSLVVVREDMWEEYLLREWRMKSSMISGW